MNHRTTRGQITFLSRYSRQITDEHGNKRMETWNDVVNRVVVQQTRLWERALKRPLNDIEKEELEDMRQHIYDLKIVPAGRTLWLGGTDLAMKRESSQYNCAATVAETLYDIVDIFWLLLQGCGVGFRPVVGTLNGFKKKIETLRIVRSKRTNKGGYEHNVETFDVESKTWTIKLGDSAEAWAKFIGKILAHKYKAKHLVLDFTEIRPAGTILSGYGWRSSGDEQIVNAIPKIINILNMRVDQMLTRIDILDICNLLGTVLSSRRSAEICVMEYGEDEWEAFAKVKKNF